MQFCMYDAMYTGLWATAGSTLGFFSFRRNAMMSNRVVILQCILSIGVGLLVAYPITEYLHEVNNLSKRLSMMFGGIGAFGLPDFILTNYTKLTTALADKVIDEATDEATSKLRRRMRSNEEHYTSDK